MNIALCGFMGSGKSTVAVKLAERLGYTHVDTDNKIVEENNNSIANIFSKFGEKTFRQIEKDTLTNLQGASDAVIALGGGSVLNPENVEILRNLVKAKIIYLKVPFEVCYERVKNCCSRPLIISKSKNEIEKLYMERDLVYAAVSDIIIESSDSETSVESILKNITKEG